MRRLKCKLNCLLLGTVLSTGALAMALSGHAAGLSAAEPGMPCGIFTLDSRSGGKTEEGKSLRDSNIRDYAFVEGYAWRTSWADLEPEAGNYDFSSIDHIIARLEAIDKKLALLLMSVDPAYIAERGNVDSWVDEHKRLGRMKRAVPWSPYLLDRYKDFMSALSEHQVYSKALGKEVALRDHPTLTVLNTGVPGWGPLRQLGGRRINQLPGYTRDKFKMATLTALRTARENFPDQYFLIGLWRMNDGVSPPLQEVMRKSILEEFNGIAAPRIGFFQDNLAASKNPHSARINGYPRPRFAEPLYLSRNETYIGFQALQGWKQPFRSRDKVANATPADGIQFAFETYNARYFELYVRDLDEPGYRQDLVKWSEILCTEGDR